MRELMMKIRRAAVCGILLLVVGACGDNPLDPSDGGTLSVAGTWTGTIEDNLRVTGPVSLTLFHAQGAILSNISGSWTTGFRGNNANGIVSGSFTELPGGDDLQLQFRSNNGGFPQNPCFPTSAGGTANGSTMTVTYVIVSGCGESKAGKLTLTKQN
jgi:hypothetical protein